MKHLLKCLLMPGIIVVLALLLIGCNVNVSTSGTSLNPTGTASSSGSSGTPHWGVQTKTSGCQAHGGLQDSACTPGDIFPNATKSQICVPGYTRTVRNVPTSEKNQVYAEYGITHHASGEFEIDHLVPLEIGGSNDISNLWPEAANPTPGFHQKDKVENYLHDQMCSGAISLAAAQAEIATNWLAVYNQMPAQNK